MSDVRSVYSLLKYIVYVHVTRATALACNRAGETV